METINVFILAAGFGERLRPITDHIPKPLLPVIGKPVLGTILDRISSLSVKQIGINMHHKHEMLLNWLKESSYSEKIKLFYEDKILGTGGALKNAESFLRGSVFLVHNSDVLSDINLDRLVREHQSSKNIVTLAVQNNQKFNNVWIDKEGLLKFIGKTALEDHKELYPTTFTGIAVYSPEFLDFLPSGNSSIINAWLRAESSGLKVGTVDFSGCRWSDIGSPSAYYSAVIETLKEDGENVYIHPSIDCNRVDINGCLVMEKGVIVEREASLTNCILLPGAKVSRDSELQNAIIGPDYVLNIEEPLSFPIPDYYILFIKDFLKENSESISMSLIGTGGSDRKYYRIKDKEKTVILMECIGTDPDYQRHITYTLFFKKYSIPVPELLTPAISKGGEDVGKLALFEDLGDLSLYSWLKCSKEPERVEKLYRLALDIVVNLNTIVAKNVTECPMLQSRLFDYEHLRWETSYFIERFVIGLNRVDIKEREKLNKEFDRLARKVDTFRKSIVHRDFQSQNIMVTRGDIPRLVDYQGARIGPSAYDIASVLWDPYARLEDNMRERLLNYYIERMKLFSDNDFDETEFRQTILPCRLQRHMQALGAYSFLSMVKGKKYFLKYIPQALQYLKEEVALIKNEYPVLYNLVKDLLRFQ